MDCFQGKNTNDYEDGVVNYATELIECTHLNIPQELAGGLIEIIKRLDDRCEELKEEVTEALGLVDLRDY